MLAFPISGDLSYTTVKELRKTLLTKIKVSSHIMINIDNLGKLDCAGMQILYSLNKWLNLHGGSMRLSSNESSQRINNLAEKIGMPQFRIGEEDGPGD